MTAWLLFPAVLFAYLAYDAWRLQTQSDAAPYEVEAKVRDESVIGVSLREQAGRQAWSRRFGVGNVNSIVWVWVVLAGGCAVGAVLGAVL